MMAATFVPISLPITCYGTKSFSKRGAQKHTNSSPTKCVASPSEDHPMEQEHGPWGTSVLSPTKDESWGRSRGEERLDWSFAQVEEKYVENWGLKPISPTLLGYEILEERAKFTVFKILVTGIRGDSWMVFRRYTDFCSLNNKLKELFPGFCAALPPASKCWFRESYNKEFLEQRLIRLQVFLKELTSHKDVIRSEVVRCFLCLDDPLSPFDSLEESRAFCETLEETNHHLQRKLLEKQSEADKLKKTLKQKEKTIDLLLKKSQSQLFSSEGFEDFCKTAERISDDRENEHEQKHRRK